MFSLTQVLSLTIIKANEAEYSKYTSFWFLSHFLLTDEVKM